MRLRLSDNLAATDRSGDLKGVCENLSLYKLPESKRTIQSCRDGMAYGAKKNENPFFTY
jgi:hypothetical protein